MLKIKAHIREKLPIMKFAASRLKYMLELHKCEPPNQIK